MLSKTFLHSGGLLRLTTSFPHFLLRSLSAPSPPLPPPPPPYTTHIYTNLALLDSTTWRSTQRGRHSHSLSHSILHLLRAGTTTGTSGCAGCIRYLYITFISHLDFSLSKNTRGLRFKEFRMAKQGASHLVSNIGGVLSKEDVLNSTDA